MIFRGIDGTEDWSFGKGRNSYFTKQAAINANIQTRLYTFLGECFFALQTGVDWWNLLGGKNPAALTGIVTQCRSIIINSYGVVQVNSIVPEFDPVTRKLRVTYNINSIFTRSVSQSITVS